MLAPAGPSVPVDLANPLAVDPSVTASNSTPLVSAEKSTREKDRKLSSDRPADIVDRVATTRVPYSELYGQLARENMPNGWRPETNELKDGERRPVNAVAEAERIQARKREAIEAAADGYRVAIAYARSITEHASAVAAINNLERRVSTQLDRARASDPLPTLPARSFNTRAVEINLTEAYFSRALRLFDSGRGELRNIAGELLATDYQLAGRYAIITDVPAFDARRDVQRVSGQVTSAETALRDEQMLVTGQYNSVLAA